MDSDLHHGQLARLDCILWQEHYENAIEASQLPEVQITVNLAEMAMLCLHDGNDDA